MEVPEAVDKYPEVKTFGPTIPAYGIWARHVKGLVCRNISFRLKNNDLRPAFVCEDGKEILLEGWNIPSTKGAEAIIRMEEVKGAHIKNMKVKRSTGTFVQLEGSSNSEIKLSGNKTPGLKKKAEIITRDKQQTVIP